VEEAYYDPNWFGLIHCKILPPRGLYIPVLSLKQKTADSHKLMFGLCRRCMERCEVKCSHHKPAKCPNTCDQCHEFKSSACQHTDAERSITGLWTTTEIKKALEKGYKIIEIYEVQYFKEKSTDLWKSYINKFMKIKLETSPFSCTEKEYREKARQLGIELGDLKPNPGLRFISKICLNLLWGTFEQNPKITRREYVDDVKKFHNVVLNKNIENLSVASIDDNLIYLTYEEKDECNKTSYNTNIYVACFTTSNARLKKDDI